MLQTLSVYADFDRFLFDRKEGRDIFNCSCRYFQNKKKFCIHLIAVLNEIGIRNASFSDTWGEKDENQLFACLEKIQNL